MKIPKWLEILQTVGLTALQASPLKAIAVPVAHAIAIAEGDGGSGASKLAKVLPLAVDAATVAQHLGVDIDPALVQAAGAAAISTAIQVTNIVHQAQGGEAKDTPDARLQAPIND